MRKRRFTEAQIVQILAEGEQGGQIRALCRRHGISEKTYYRWVARYGGLQASKAKRLKTPGEALCLRFCSV